ncbi:MAG: hypothetical protein R2796_11095 [Chitinophagaceae bacterium]
MNKTEKILTIIGVAGFVLIIIAFNFKNLNDYSSPFINWMRYVAFTLMAIAVVIQIYILYQTRKLKRIENILKIFRLLLPAIWFFLESRNNFSNLFKDWIKYSAFSIITVSLILEFYRWKSNKKEKSIGN